METLIHFTAGAITLGFLIAGLFFLRFWRSTREGLFLAFAVAFSMLGVGQAMLIFMNVRDEERSLLYLVRLGAFMCILVAIWRKNRSVR